MLNVTIYKDFIAVNVRSGISKYATEIMKEDYSNNIDVSVRVLDVRKPNEILESHAN